MAGGIGTYFQLNPKCLIFIFMLMLAYYALPVNDLDIYNYYIPIITAISVLLYMFLYSCQNTGALTVIGVIILLIVILQFLYWNLPRKLWSVYYAIFFFGYVSLAYFDYVMDCSIPLKAGTISFTHLFKIK